jgi:SGNH hydrolase-like domain, acetyltransferase AlgX
MEVKTARGRLFIFLMLVVAFPLLQQSLSFFESGKVHGAVANIPDSSFAWDRWWTGRYQKQKNDYLNDNTGCRPDLVRINNQVDYWLFGKLHANGVVIGKDDYIYEQFYIDEYNGKDYLGDQVIRDMFVKLKKVQDTLDHLGKSFVFLYAPSKAYYFPGNFPASLNSERRPVNTNYTMFKRMGDSLGIHQVDFNAWFLAMKDTSKNLLFSRLGTHWTVYGSLLTGDSLIRYLERVRNVRIPRTAWDSIKYSYQPQRTDDDLAAGLNLITEFRKERFTYPKYYYNYKNTNAMPNAVYIGDSFVWTWVNNGLMHNINKEWDLWYYFNEGWNERSFSGLESMRPLESFDWAKEMMNMDCIIVLYTPANFKGLNYEGAFIEKMYRYFYPAGN